MQHNAETSWGLLRARLLTRAGLIKSLWAQVLTFQRGAALTVLTRLSNVGLQHAESTSITVQTPWSAGRVVCDMLLPASAQPHPQPRRAQETVEAAAGPQSQPCAQPAPPSSRTDCGHDGTNQQSCEASGCCWAPVNPNPGNAPWCYKPASPSPPPSPSPPSPPPPPSPPGPAPPPGGGCITVGGGGNLVLSVANVPRVFLPQDVALQG